MSLVGRAHDSPYRRTDSGSPLSTIGEALAPASTPTAAASSMAISRAASTAFTAWLRHAETTLAGACARITAALLCQASVAHRSCTACANTAAQSTATSTRGADPSASCATTTACRSSSTATDSPTAAADSDLVSRLPQLVQQRPDAAIARAVAIMG